MCIEIAIGTTVGVATKNIGFWIPIGLSLGMGLGLATRHNSDNNGRSGIDRQLPVCRKQIGADLSGNNSFSEGFCLPEAHGSTSQGGA